MQDTGCLGLMHWLSFEGVPNDLAILERLGEIFFPFISLLLLSTQSLPPSIQGND